MADVLGLVDHHIQHRRHDGRRSPIPQSRLQSRPVPPLPTTQRLAWAPPANGLPAWSQPRTQHPLRRVANLDSLLIPERGDLIHNPRHPGPGGVCGQSLREQVDTINALIRIYRPWPPPRLLLLRSAPILLRVDILGRRGEGYRGVPCAVTK
jgi:hypothetical protein